MWHVLGQAPQQLDANPVDAKPADSSDLAWLLPQSSPVQVSQLSQFDPFGCLPMQNNRRHSELFHFRE